VQKTAFSVGSLEAMRRVVGACRREKAGILGWLRD
jgi:hypothetical protein